MGKSMFQNCCNLFKVYRHIAWTIFQICADLRNEVLALSKQVKSLQVKVDELENESTVMKSALNSVSKFQLSPRLVK